MYTFYSPHDLGVAVFSIFSDTDEKTDFDLSACSVMMNLVRKHACRLKSYYQKPLVYENKKRKVI